MQYIFENMYLNVAFEAVYIQKRIMNIFLDPLKKSSYTI